MPIMRGLKLWRYCLVITQQPLFNPREILSEDAKSNQNNDELNFKNSRWRTTAILKIVASPCFSQGDSILMTFSFWSGAELRRKFCVHNWKFYKFEMADGRKFWTLCPSVRLICLRVCLSVCLSLNLHWADGADVSHDATFSCSGPAAYRLNPRGDTLFTMHSLTRVLTIYGDRQWRNVSRSTTFYTRPTFVNCSSVIFGISHPLNWRRRQNLLNIWEFVYFVWCLSPPKRRVVRRRNFARRRVPTICKTSAGFYVSMGRSSFLPKVPACIGVYTRSKACAINSVTTNSTGSAWGRWLAGCILSRFVSAVQSSTKSCCSGPTGLNSL